MSEQNGKALPAGWCSTPLEELGLIKGGGTPTTYDQRFWEGGTIPWVSPKDMKSFSVCDAQDRITHHALKESSTKMVEVGAVLLVIRSGILQHTLPVGVAAVPMALNQDLKAIEPHPGIQSRYLAYALIADRVRILRECSKTGTTVQSIEIPQLRRFQIPIAPSSEQIRIADKLDELLSDLDAGVKALEGVRAKLKQYRAAVLKAAVEGTLTAEWRARHPDVEPADKLLERILAERRRRWEEAQLKKYADAGKSPPKGWREKYRQPVEPDLIGLPQLPKGWLWASMDQVADLAGGVTKGHQFRAGDRTREVPYLRVANVQRGYLDLAQIKTIVALESDIAALKLERGDVLFNEGGDRDKLGRGWVWEGQVEECIHQNHVFRARVFLNALQPKLVSWCGNSYGQEWFSRTGKQSVNLASINLGVLRSFPVPIVPLREQTVVTDTIEAQLSVIDHLESDLDAKLKSAAALRQSILKAAFEGKLVPQDPADEPASELLKRIAAERAERERLAKEAKAAVRKKPTEGQTPRRGRTPKAASI